MFIISISLGGPSTSSKRHLCRGKLQKVCGGYFGSTPNIAVGTQKHIFDKLLDNFTSNNIHHQMLLFADKQNFEKNISACRQKHSQQMLLEDKKYFCNKIFWFAIQNIFCDKIFWFAGKKLGRRTDLGSDSGWQNIGKIYNSGFASYA